MVTAADASLSTGVHSRVHFCGVFNSGSCFPHLGGCVHSILLTGKSTSVSLARLFSTCV